MIVFVFGAQCTISKKQSRSTTAEIVSTAEGDIYQRIVSQNLTSDNFFIEKVDFNVFSREGKKSGIGTIKFVMPDKFLISIKSKTGIEIGRIYLTGDSIMLNDRINKKLYYGSASYLKKKYGLTMSILPVILGDYVNEEIINRGSLECKNGILDIDAIIKEIRIRYVVDCKYGKPIMTTPIDNGNPSGLKIKYNNFFWANGINVPGDIDISDDQNSTRIEIKIRKIIFPWAGSIEFIPGKQYEKIHLL